MKNSSFAAAGDIGSHGGPNTTYGQHRFLWPLAHGVWLPKMITILNCSLELEDNMSR
jgi:hypothetical protein